jgi:hypothetical protein
LAVSLWGGGYFYRNSKEEYNSYKEKLSNVILVEEGIAFDRISSIPFRESLRYFFIADNDSEISSTTAFSAINNYAPTNR